MAEKTEEGRKLKVREVFMLEREGNRGSTGYDWYLTRLEGPVALVSEDYEQEKKTFTFEALQDGVAYVQLAFMRLWEPDKALYEDVLPFVIEEADTEPAVNELLGIKAGGWTPFKPLDADSEAAFKEALAKLVGVDYKPLLAAVQTVNGRNYLFAVNAKISGGGNAYAALIRAYKAPGAAAVITNITQLGHPCSVGSYGAFEAVPPEAQAALDETRRVGLDFTANYVATQLVAGRNYLFAGNAKYATLHAHEFPAFVTVYKPLEGKAQITSVRAAYEA
ncbi:MAG: protease inhibitor I42 family protein [Spirochaetaceae bacterium]|jgi:predicted secreted protein|nr:protease inhibitor I42 family protein [Spirochaetaceae bacterium]